MIVTDNVSSTEERRKMMCKTMIASIVQHLQKMDFATLQRAHKAIRDIASGRN